MALKGEGLFYSRAEYKKAYTQALVAPNLSRNQQYYSKNRRRVIRKSATWAKDNKEKLYLYHLRGKFDLEPASYFKLLKKQKNKCAICGGSNKNKRLCVDHCHTSGLVRGLLCDRCNIGLGKFYDSPILIKKAWKYLCS